MTERTELIKEVIELQRKVDRAQRPYRLDAWMRLHLTIAQLKSLFFLSNHGSTSLGRLAEALGVTPTNTSGIIDRLVKRGLVSRSENPENRRMLSIRTTEKGEQLISGLRSRKHGYMAQVLDRLPGEDLAALARGLAALTGAIEAEKKESK